MTAPAKSAAQCAGNMVITERRVDGPGYRTRACRGCPDCARRPLAEPTAADVAKAFARLPVVVDEEW